MLWSQRRVTSGHPPSSCLQERWQFTAPVEFVTLPIWPSCSNCRPLWWKCCSFSTSGSILQQDGLQQRAYTDLYAASTETSTISGTVWMYKGREFLPNLEWKVYPWFSKRKNQFKEYFSVIKGNGLNIYFEEKTFFNEKKKKRTFSTSLNGMWTLLGSSV